MVCLGNMCMATLHKGDDAIIIIIIITTACEQLASTEYAKRHDGVAKVIHQKLAEAAELIEDKSSHYGYTPANVLDNDNFKLYWNHSIMHKTIPADRPDITFMNKKTKTTYLIDTAVPMIDTAVPMIDTAVPNTHNLAKTIAEKQSKYQELANEICAMWKQNTVQVILIVISSTGVIPKSPSQSLKILNLH